MTPLEAHFWRWTTGPWLVVCYLWSLVGEPWYSSRMHRWARRMNDADLILRLRAWRIHKERQLRRRVEMSERLCRHWVGCWRVHQKCAVAACEQLVDALRALHDVQNGPPLPTWEKDWNEAMAKAGAALNRWEEP